MLFSSLLFASLFLGIVQGKTISIYDRLDQIGTAIIDSVGYFLLAPVKMGNMEFFLANNSITAPTPVTLLPSKSTNATLNSPTQQMMWAFYDAGAGLWPLTAYDNNGTFLYYAQWVQKNMMPYYTYRGNWPSDVPATNSPYDPVSPALTGNCRARYYINSVGVPTYSFSNSYYDVKARPFYQTCKSSLTPIYGGVRNFASGLVGSSYCRPFYASAAKAQAANKADFLGIIAFDFPLTAVQNALLSVNSPDIVSYIYESNNPTATNADYLVATSVGEILSSGAKNDQPKPAGTAKNSVIKESYNYIKSSGIKTDGFYEYTSASNGNQKYLMKLTTWTDPTTSSITWKIISSIPMSTQSTDYSIYDQKNTVNAVAADIKAFTDDATYTTNYLTFLSGQNPNLPLTTTSALLETETPVSITGPTQQTMWGAISSFPNAHNVWIGYANKTTVHYSKLTESGKSYGNYYFRPAGTTADYVGYNISSKGIPDQSKPTYRNKNYDPTTRPWYKSSISDASWSSFFQLETYPQVPVIAYSAPIYSQQVNPPVLRGVVAVSRLMSSFTDICIKYLNQADVIYIMDTNRNLIATSTNEVVWPLKQSRNSTNSLISASANFLVQNQISQSNAYTTIVPDGRKLMIVLKAWSDSTQKLNLQIVSVQEVPNPTLSPTLSPVNAPTLPVYPSSDDEVATITQDASIAAAVFASFVFIMGIVGMIATFSPATLGLKAPLSSSGSAGKSNL